MNMHESIKQKISFRDIAYSVPWNLALLTFGALCIAVAINAVAIPHGFMAGGVSGLGILLYYMFPSITPGFWFLVLNIPIFMLGFFTISRRFFLYSIYCARARQFPSGPVLWVHRGAGARDLFPFPGFHRGH